MDQKLEPGRINKPIQLLAAWLTGLVLVNGSFLSSAAIISAPNWIAPTLVIAAIVNVPIFLAAIFLLQTKFRPEMQEDAFYSQYLNSITQTDSGDEALTQLSQMRTENSSFNSSLTSILQGLQKDVTELTTKSQNEHSGAKSTRANLRLAELELLQKQTKERKTRIQVNDLLPNFREIMSGLSSANLSVEKTFGSTSRSTEIPKVFLLSFGKSVELDTLKSVFKIAVAANLQFIGFVIETGMNSDIIYLGSYAYKLPERIDAAITDELIKKLLKSDSMEKFIGIVIDYSKRP